MGVAEVSKGEGMEGEVAHSAHGYCSPERVTGGNARAGHRWNMDGGRRKTEESGAAPPKERDIGVDCAPHRVGANRISAAAFSSCFAH